MSALLYGIALQCIMDIRSKAMLVTAYIVPLLFFLFIGGIFTSLTPETTNTLISSMSIMGISMGSLIGMPPSIAEIYGTNIKRMYSANGIPLYYGLFTFFISTFVHLMIMSTIIFVLAPIIFDAKIPDHIPFYFINLALFTIASLSIASLLGLLIKNPAKLTMYAQIIFLPSIMLSGIMFPTNLLPETIRNIGHLFPATWGFRLLSQPTITLANYIPLLLTCTLMAILCFLRFKHIRST